MARGEQALLEGTKIDWQAAKKHLALLIVWTFWRIVFTSSSHKT
jgi:hypothetical protein